jgi:hypothetical protein
VDSEDQGSGLGQVLRFRRSVDVYSTKITFDSKGDPQPGPPNRISEYQLDFDEEGRAFEIEWNSLGNLIYGGMTLPFHGDYLANAVSKWRKNPVTGNYQSNAGPIGDVTDEINNVRYFAAWTDHRRIRGVLYDDAGYDPYSGQDLPQYPDDPGLPFETVDESGLTQRNDADANGDAEAIDDNVRLANLDGPDARQVGAMDRLPGGPMARARAAVTNKRPDRFLSAYGVRAEGLKDREASQPAPPTCKPSVPPAYPAGYQTNAKNAEIYGAVVDPSVRLVSPVIGKGFLTKANSPIPLQRGFVVGVDNISAEEPADPTEPARRVLLVIANQPGETPMSPDMYVPLPPAPVLPNARASWRQLPFGPNFVAGVDPAPDIDEIVAVDPLETEYVTLFVVASVNNAPVTVYAYDADNCDADKCAFLGQLTVNGNADLGDLIDAPGVIGEESINLTEIHDPELIEPVWGDLEIIPLSESYDNPNVRSPNVRSPNVRSTAYQNPNVRSPNVRSVTYESTTKEATSLQSPNVRSPNVRSTSLTADSFIDVTYTVESDNNTITAVNADFGYGGNEIVDDNVQVIAWREDQLATAEGCENGFITESKVISSKKSPNVRSLAPADISEPFQGEVTFTLAPAGPDATAFVTVRVFCNNTVKDTASGLTQCEDLKASKLEENIGYNFWAQKANTGKTEINQDNEQVIKDVIDPVFNKDDGHQFRVEATDPGGALIDITTGTGTANGEKIEAEDNGLAVDVNCEIAIDGDPSMPPSVKVPVGDSLVTCTAEDFAAIPNVGEWSGSIRVEDNTQPVLATTPPGQTVLKVPPTSRNGASVDFIALLGIAATDAIANDADLVVSCTLQDGTAVESPASFPIGETPVSCTATDPGPCDPSLAWCENGVNVSAALDFVVTVEDSEAPVIVVPDGGLPPILYEATGPQSSINLVADFAPEFSDTIDPDPILTVTPEGPFGLGEFQLTWKATDFALNVAEATQTLIVQDTTDPVITVPGDIVRKTYSLSGLNISFEVTARDVGDVSDVSIACVKTRTATVINPGGYLFPVGTTSVTCTASDTEGNPTTPEGSTATGTFDVTVEFEYGIVPMSTTKTNPKAGTSIPITWALTDNGINQDVGSGNQSVTVFESACEANGSVLAEDPGSSGIQLLPGNIYQYNWQAVYPASHQNAGQDLPAPATYCIEVSVNTTGQKLNLTIDLNP